MEDGSNVTWASHIEHDWWEYRREDFTYIVKLREAVALGIFK